MIFNVFSGYNMSVVAISIASIFVWLIQRANFTPGSPAFSTTINQNKPFSTTTTPSPLKSSSSRGFMATRNTCSYTSKVQLHQSFVIRKAIDADTW